MSKVACNILWCLSSRKIKLSAEAKFMRVSCLRSCQKGQMPLTFGLWFLSRVSVVSRQKVIGNWSGPFSCFPYTTTSYVLYRRMLFVRWVFVQSFVKLRPLACSSSCQFSCQKVISQILYPASYNIQFPWKFNFRRSWASGWVFWEVSSSGWQLLSFYLSESHWSDPISSILYPITLNFLDC